MPPQQLPELEQVRTLETPARTIANAEWWAGKVNVVQQKVNRQIAATFKDGDRGRIESTEERRLAVERTLFRSKRLAKGTSTTAIENSRKNLQASIDELGEKFQTGIKQARIQHKKFGEVDPATLEDLRETAQALQIARHYLSQRPTRQPVQPPQKPQTPEQQRMQQLLEELLEGQRKKNKAHQDQHDQFDPKDKELRDQMKKMGDEMKMNDHQEPPQPQFFPEHRKKFSPSMDERKGANGESSEQNRQNPIAIIEPPLQGYYRTNVFDSFDSSTVEWEERANTVEYPDFKGPGSHTMKGMIEGYIALPLPKGYVICKDTLQANEYINLTFDPTHGTTYLESATPQEFSLEFREDSNVATTSKSTKPAAYHKENIITGNLSTETEAVLAGAKKLEPTEAALMLAKYIKINFEYSGDESYNYLYKNNPSRYFQKIDEHRKVDCDVGATFFAGLCRSIGIPACMIVGYSVPGSKNGKVELHNSQRHAWAEIWDKNTGTWLTIDPQPPAPPDEDGDPIDPNNPSADADLECDIPPPPKPHDKAREQEDNILDALERNKDNVLTDGDLDALCDQCKGINDALENELEQQLSENHNILEEHADALERAGEKEGADDVREQAQALKETIDEYRNDPNNPNVQRKVAKALQQAQTIAHEKARRLLAQEQLRYMLAEIKQLRAERDSLD